MNPRQQTYEALVRRSYPHPVSRVYRAWVLPEHIAGWWKPNEQISMRVVQFDLMIGGQYRFEYRFSDGLFPVRGNFLTVEPERTLIFTWQPQEPDVDAGKDTLVSVWFRRLSEGATEVEVRHTLFPDETMRQRHEDGWAGTMEQLSRYLTVAGTPTN